MGEVTHNSMSNYVLRLYITPMFNYITSHVAAALINNIVEERVREKCVGYAYNQHRPRPSPRPRGPYPKGTYK